MKNRKEIKLFSIAINLPLTLASLFRLDPAVDQLLQHIERDTAIAQDHFMELTDIKLSPNDFFAFSRSSRIFSIPTL